MTKRTLQRIRKHLPEFLRHTVDFTLPLLAFAAMALLVLVSSAPAAESAAPPEKKDLSSASPCANSNNCISVDFDKARLSEVAFMVSELTGEGFVFDEAAKTPAISWSQQGVPKTELLPTFIKVLTALGLTVHRIEDSNFWAIRTEPSLVSGAEKLSSGVYHLKYLSAESVQKSAEALYGKRLASYGAKDSKVVTFAGDPDLVADFAQLLSDVDQPPQTDSGIATIRLKHISVRTALKAVADLRIFGKSIGSSDVKSEDGNASKETKSPGSVFPDYWNRSVVVNGSKAQQDTALLALSAIDKPQEGYVDEVVFLQTIPADQALAVLQDLYESLTVRKIADDRLLISGEEKLVDKALAIVSRMDGTGLQVKVEAVIAQLTDREFRELGMKLAYKTSSFGTSFNDGLSSALLSSTPGLLVDYIKGFFQADLSATDSIASGRIISSPMLTVLNGQEAQIVVGQNVPFLGKADSSKKEDSDDDDNQTSVERKDVGLSFKVKPVIRPDGDFITLTISQELSNVNPDSQLSSAVDLIVDKKSLSTTVLAGNGDTVFLGGLRADESGKSFDTVPLLGDIPLIGPLFTYEARTTDIRHLVISLRVYVVAAPQPVNG